ncbi:MAG TPA: RluA family pseudouridine synthase [Bacteroidales bacterium]|nr:RluA family pseudouridine synthase [Bacteroidales bacterium]HPS18500.1 RluA family pseudouridine synthase [Bacteroidales bacterium]
MLQNTNKKSNIKDSKQKEIFFTVMEQSELMKFLIAKMPDKSRTTIKSYLSHRQVSVNGQIISQFNHLLNTEDKVKINFGKVAEIVKYKGLKIIFEDDDIIVIEKEPGLLSIATEKERQETAYFILLEHVRIADRNNRVYILHRLDKDASGIMIFAKSEKIQELIQRNWKQNIVERKYAVLVEGKMENDEGTHISWLKESSALIMYSYQFDNGGQKAITHYNVIKKNDNYSLLEVKIDTGRKNQIRVHMQDLKHSIVGDKKYGSTQNPIKRMGLHAMSLALKHPVTNENLKFESPIPQSFLKLVN